MTPQRDAELAVRAWLEPGTDRLSPESRRAVLAEIATRPQLDRVRPAMDRTRPARRWIAVAAMLAVAIPLAVAGIGVFPGRQPAVNVAPTGSAPSPSGSSPSPALSAGPSTPVASLGRVPVEGDPVAIVLAPSTTASPKRTPRPTSSPLPFPSSGPVAPGRYAIPHLADTVSGYRFIDLTVPAGWVVDGQRLVKRAGQPDEAALSWWVVSEVLFDPCHWLTSAASPIDLKGHEHTTEGMTLHEAPAAGLLGQLGRVHSSPVLTSLGGVGAVWIQLSVPELLPVSACDDGRYVAWTEDQRDPLGVVITPNARLNDFAQPGQIDDVYEVDVDRAPLVVDASHGPAASASDLAELQGILDSMEIER
jgi:hypothetical protein